MNVRLLQTTVGLALWCFSTIFLRAQSFDIVVYGGTPGGVAAAIAAAQLGHSVALVEYHNHLGGMAASGLGKSDVEHREAIGGLWNEFVARVYAHYVKTYGAGSENAKLSREGYYYEPSVAESVFDGMVAEQPRITVLKRHRLESTSREGRRVVAAQFTDRNSGLKRELRAAVFIDATYEGDLAAAAGAAYRLDREGRADFNELHAGVVYMDHETRTFLAGTTGEGDKRLQAYTFRLCLTKDPANSYVLKAPPEGYDRARYLGYFDDLKSGRFAPPKQMRDGVGFYAPTFNTMVRSLSMADIPNGKLDINMNPRALGFPFTEENYGYPEAKWDEREKITAHLCNLTLGLLYFLQNDSEIPEDQRKLARQFNLAADEFKDNYNFPWQLYVREARRIVGEYTLSENDLILGPALGRTHLHRDSIAAGEYPIDSFPVRKYERGHDVALEGYILMLEKYTNPYQIPYRVIVPAEIDGLLVPVAASTTHIAFSSIRLEPTWMALGQAAATAAHLSLRDKVPVRAVPIDVLQRELLNRGQVITFFNDIEPRDPAYAALQYFGTKGFFPNYFARAHEPLDRTQARAWLKLILGDKSAVAVGVLPLDGAFTGEDFSAVAAKSGWAGAFIKNGVLTRGEFCRMLYEATPALAAPAPIKN